MAKRKCLPSDRQLWPTNDMKIRAQMPISLSCIITGGDTGSSPEPEIDSDSNESVESINYPARTRRVHTNAGCTADSIDPDVKVG